EGKVSLVRIKDGSRPIKQYSDVTIQLNDQSSCEPTARIISSSSDELDLLDLKKCKWKKGSSTTGVDAIETPKGVLIVIIDKNQSCVELLNRLRNYLIDDDLQNAEELSKAINASNYTRVAQLTKLLAQSSAKIQFTIDPHITNEQKPIAKPIKLKLTIESHLIEHCTNEKFDISIMPNTVIADLKRLIQKETKVEPEQQSFYCDREILDDNYVFGAQNRPILMDGSVLTLYITKPQKQ
ncbi:unnamed protein product, partial [Didymodactylos carnosus]